MDVVVIGGGIVGLTMANLLACNKDLQIALLEPNTPLLEWDAAIYDVRCSAINPAVRNVFSYLGVWDDIVAQRLSMYDRMLVWDQQPHNKIEFNANALGAYNLGYIIENRVMAKALYLRLLQQSNVEIIPSNGHSLTSDQNNACLSIGTRTLECKLVIGADGINSWLRDQSQIQTYGWDYQHTALVATIQTQFPHESIAQQRFMPDGPLAFLPLAESNLCSIVWSSNPTKIQALMRLDNIEFCMQLANEFAFKLGKLSLQSPRACFPLRMLHAERYIATRAVLIGDSAHVIHPLAGQGLNLGVLDAAVLAEVLQSAWLQNQDIGQVQVLRKYELRRKSYNFSMITLLEMLKRIFASETKSLALLRAQGLHLLNNFDFAKNAMMRFAMGLGGDLPEIARGCSIS